MVYVDDILVTGDNFIEIMETAVTLHKAFKIKDLRELKCFLVIEFARSEKGIVMHQRKYSLQDILVTGENLNKIMETKATLHISFKIKDLGELKCFLGIEFARSEKEIVMHQKKYALELISETILSVAKPTSIFMDTTTKFTTKEYNEHYKLPANVYDELLTDPSTYQRLVGKLLYLTVTRFGISYSVQNLSLYVQHPKQSHLEAAESSGMRQEVQVKRFYYQARDKMS